VAQDEPHVSVWGLLEASQRGNKGHFGKEGMHEESDSRKEEQHTCIHEDLMTLRLGFLQCIVMVGKLEKT
jgi:hypothetical protein